MIKATYQGNEVLSVTAYDSDAGRYVWITVKKYGTIKSLCVPMSKVFLEEKE